MVVTPRQVLFAVLVVLCCLSHGRVSTAQQCIRIQDNPYLKDCILAGYNYTFPLPKNLSGRTKWMIKFVASKLTKAMKNCSVAQVAETIGCALIAPYCREGNPEPFLPCRRVCSEFLKRCRDQVPAWYMDDLTGKCLLLPNGNAAKGECYEPPQFSEKHINASVKDPLHAGCYDLVNFPFCRELGYQHTIITPEDQKNVYRFFYLKNITDGNPEVPAPGSHIVRVKSLMKDFPKCAQGIHKFFCGRIVPPCFPEEGKAYYSVCQSVCKSVGEDCPEIFKSRGGRYFMACERLAEGTTGHGFCKYTSWPSPKLWGNYLQASPNKNSKKPVDVVLVTVVVVVVIAVVAAITLTLLLLWKKNKLFGVFHVPKQDDDDQLHNKTQDTITQ